ncbi:HAD family hydrolase [Tsukamurella paurometabola]|uniref:Phosphatase yihX n=1 Tax=Tsukamurella paurometabola TaxID=2061 RepID=A0A3P8MEY8_TSUPA|nr:HAD family phosphatase [Tsukamurella paurometabola]UEA83919.1 HAD family phosphatase [Tsukamurella paurometabola]VDR41073.1 Phosphatase yihX [Tsukamurella paurometabola]
MTAAAAAETRVDAVLFDYGGVLTAPMRHSIEAWIAEEGIEPESFTATLKAWLGRDAEAGSPIHRLETGELPEAEFDAVFAAALRTRTGAPVDPDGVLRRMFARIQEDPAMWRLAADLRAAGVPVAIVSNSWGGGNLYPRERLAALFAPVIISEEVGLRKPDPAIFRLALERLGVRPERAAFIDDATPNVDGAAALGIHAIHHIDAGTTRAALRGLVPALAETPIHL